MKKQFLWILASMTLGLTACSESTENTQSPNPQVQSQVQPQGQSPTATSAPVGPPTNGKVVKAMHAGGYTYMQLESQGKQFWVAATMMNVKRNDHVAWTDAAVMKNFNSPTLRRTFEEILFVSAAKVE